MVITFSLDKGGGLVGGGGLSLGMEFRGLSLGVGVRGVSVDVEVK